jgi:hypothetical protein
VVVVSVVIGIFAVVVIIIILAMVSCLRRWEVIQHFVKLIPSDDQFPSFTDKKYSEGGRI